MAAKTPGGGQEGAQAQRPVLLGHAEQGKGEQGWSCGGCGETRGQITQRLVKSWRTCEALQRQYSTTSFIKVV